jgi:hypothetical protein
MGKHTQREELTEKTKAARKIPATITETIRLRRHQEFLRISWRAFV